MAERSATCKVCRMPVHEYPFGWAHKDIPTGAKHAPEPDVTSAEPEGTES